MYFSRVKDNDRFFAEFKLLGGLFTKRLEVPFIQYQGIFAGIVVKMGTKGKQGQLENVQKQRFTPERISDLYQWSKQLLMHVREFTEWLRHTLTYVKCSEFRWETRLGVGDAAETALATGMLWAVKSTLFGYIFQYVHLRAKPKLTIQPQYNHMEFSTEFSCHARIRLGLLVFSMLVLGWRIIRSKGGLRAWKRVFFKGRAHVQKA